MVNALQSAVIIPMQTGIQFVLCILDFRLRGNDKYAPEISQSLHSTMVLQQQMVKLYASFFTRALSRVNSSGRLLSGKASPPLWYQ